MDEKIVYLFSVNRYSRMEVELMRPSDFPDYCTGTMSLKELESHWNNKRNGGLTMEIEKYWCRIL